MTREFFHAMMFQNIFFGQSFQRSLEKEGASSFGDDQCSIALMSPWDEMTDGVETRDFWKKLMLMIWKVIRPNLS